MAVENGDVSDFQGAPMRKQLSGGRTLDIYPDGREVLIFRDGTEFLCPSLIEARDAMNRVKAAIARAHAESWEREEELLGPDRFRPTHITI